MKIGIYLTALPRYSETFILSKIEGLSARGHQVTVFLSSPSTERTSYKYVNPYSLGYVWFVFLFPYVMLMLFLTRFGVIKTFISKERQAGRSTIQILKSLYQNAHLLQARGLDWIHFSFATFVLGREHIAASIGARMAVSFRGFDIGIYPLKNPGCYDRLWKTVDKVHVISDDLYKLALKHGLPAAVPMLKIRPAIRTENLLVKTQPAGVEKKPCAIASIGRLEWKKGFHYALLAMSELKKRNINFTYRIVGSGSMEDELRFAIHDMGLSDSVFLEGKLKHNEVFTFLHDSDIYIQPSIQEGFCNSLLEAQGTGVLCIASNAEGLQENVLHNVTGWIVERRDYIGLANVIESIVKMDKQHKEKIADTAIARVRRDFSLERLVTEFESFYR